MTGPDGGLRVVRVDDDAGLTECVPIIRAAFRSVLDDLGLTEVDVPSNAAFLTPDRLRAAVDRGERILALRVAGRTVGSVSLRPSDPAGDVYLKRLAVAPPMWHRGYGALLLEAARADAAGQGAESVSVGIIDPNTVLKRWYERHGFVVTGIQTYDQLPFAVCYLRRPVSVPLSVPEPTPL